MSSTRKTIQKVKLEKEEFQKQQEQSNELLNNQLTGLINSYLKVDKLTVVALDSARKKLSIYLELYNHLKEEEIKNFCELADKLSELISKHKDISLNVQNESCINLLSEIITNYTLQPKKSYLHLKHVVRLFEVLAKQHTENESKKTIGKKLLSIFKLNMAMTLTLGDAETRDTYFANNHDVFLQYIEQYGSDHSYAQYYTFLIRDCLKSLDKRDLKYITAKLFYHLQRIYTPESYATEAICNGTLVTWMVVYTNMLVKNMTTDQSFNAAENIMLLYKTAIKLLKFTLAKLFRVDDRATALQIGSSPITNIENRIKYYNEQLKQYKSNRKEAYEKIFSIKLEKFMAIFAEYDCKVIEENKKGKTVSVKLNSQLALNLKLSLQKKGILTSARESSLLFIDFLHIDIDAVQKSFQDVLKAEEAAKSPIPSENTVNNRTQLAQNTVTATAVTSENAPNETNETFAQENIEVAAETVSDLTKVKNIKPEKKNLNSESLHNPSTKLSLFTIAKRPQLRIDWGHNFPVFDSHQNECTVYQLFGQLDCYFTYVSPVLLEKIDDQGLAVLRKALNKHLNIIPVNSKNLSGFMLHHQDMSIQTKRSAPGMIANKYGKLKDCKSDERYYAVEVGDVTVNNKRYHLLEINTYKPTHKKQGKLYHWPSEELQALHSRNQKAAKK